MSRLTVGSIEGLTENSNVISVPTGHSLNVADAGGLQFGGATPSPSKQDFASFGMTTAQTWGGQTPTILPFDAVLHASTDMSWAFSTANGSIPAYNWKHSQTGFYKLSFFTRTTTDNWRVLSVCTGNDYTSAVGTSVRMGSNTGSWGYSTELIYKVSDVADVFSAYLWVNSTNGVNAGFTGTPPTGFIAPTQDGASAPANGYFGMFTIIPVSGL